MWVVETAYSAFKKYFGEVTSAKKWSYMLKENIIKRHPIADNMDNNTQRNSIIVRSLIDKIPSLEGFSLDDAVGLLKGGDSELSVRSKYKSADPDIMMAVACTMLDAKKEELKKAYPEFAKEHENLGTDFLDIASTSVLYKAKDSRKYRNWTDDKLEKIVNNIKSTPSIMNNLAMIKSPDEIRTLQDAIEQYQIRRELTDQIGEVYANIYGLDNFNHNDIDLVHKSFLDYMEGSAIATAYSTTPGTVDDEIVISSYHPLVDLIRSHKLFTETSKENSATIFLKTTFEELQHTTDNIYADMLINGKLPPEHPAFEHTSLFILNSINYTDASISGQSLYEQQYLERTAKFTAQDITFEVLYAIKNQDNHNEERLQPSDIETTINPNILQQTDAIEIPPEGSELHSPNNAPNLKF